MEVIMDCSFSSLRRIYLGFEGKPDMVALGSGGLWSEGFWIMRKEMLLALKKWISTMKTTTKAHTHTHNMGSPWHVQAGCSDAFLLHHHRDNYLAVVWERIPPRDLQRTVTIPFPWGVVCIQLLGKRDTMKRRISAEALRQHTLPSVCVCVSVCEYRSTLLTAGDGWLKVKVIRFNMWEVLRRPTSPVTTISPQLTEAYEVQSLNHTEELYLHSQSIIVSMKFRVWVTHIVTLWVERLWGRPYLWENPKTLNTLELQTKSENTYVHILHWWLQSPFSMLFCMGKRRVIAMNDSDTILKVQASEAVVIWLKWHTAFG